MFLSRSATEAFRRLKQRKRFLSKRKQGGEWRYHEVQSAGRMAPS